MNILTTKDIVDKSNAKFTRHMSHSYMKNDTCQDDVNIFSLIKKKNE